MTNHDLADMLNQEIERAHRVMDRRDEEMAKHGYGRPPGTPIAKAVGLVPFIPRIEP